MLDVLFEPAMARAGRNKANAIPRVLRSFICPL
jgi:hypothetical protein